MEGGNTVAIATPDGLPINFGGVAIPLTAIVYKVGDEFALAVTVSTASGDLTGDEFYIDSANNYEARQTPSAGNVGFVALTDADCNGDRTADGDGLICELICAA
ncbi:MAG: hypothetical protein ACR2QC_11535, partial [Gammaproteobacteria bacterium]